MYLSRLEGVLGESPAGSGMLPILRKLQARAGVAPNRQRNTSFFATSGYVQASALSRKREIGRLFARLREELALVERQGERADFLSELAPVRQGLLIEMFVASEFVSDEIDATMASLVQSGKSAEASGDLENLASICKQANVYARLQKRFSEFQRELDSMLNSIMRVCSDYASGLELDFDPIAGDFESCRSFVEQFLLAVEASVDVLAKVALAALKQSDFAGAAEICTCNIQLNSFAGESRLILQELANAQKNHSAE